MASLLVSLTLAVADDVGPDLVRAHELVVDGGAVRGVCTDALI
jgi:hypothetical protein